MVIRSEAPGRVLPASMVPAVMAARVVRGALGAACAALALVATSTAGAARASTDAANGGVHASSDGTLVASSVPPSLETDPLLVPLLDAVGQPRPGVPRGRSLRTGNQLFRVYVTGVQVARQHLVITENYAADDPCMILTYGRSFSARTNAAGAMQWPSAPTAETQEHAAVGLALRVHENDAVLPTGCEDVRPSTTDVQGWVTVTLNRNEIRLTSVSWRPCRRCPTKSVSLVQETMVHSVDFADYADLADPKVPRVTIELDAAEVSALSSPVDTECGRLAQDGYSSCTFAGYRKITVDFVRSNAREYTAAIRRQLPLL